MELSIGIYRNSDKNSLYCSFQEKDTFVYFLNGVQLNPEDVALHEDSIVYQDITYNRYYGNGDPHIEAISAIPFVGGTTGRILHISENYVFKTAERGKGDMNTIGQEISRILTLLAHGIPHAECYGLLMKDDKYYIIEERLDIEGFERDICAIKKQLREIPDKSIKLYHPSYQLLLDYITSFQHIVQTLREKDFGGDFKLDNMGYRRGSKTLLLTDASLPTQENPYIPRSWCNWFSVAKEESRGNVNIYLNPMSRLVYKQCIPKVGGGTRRRKPKRQTRKH